MSVEVGQKAPEIHLYDEQQEPFQLSDYRGQKVLLLFFPGAFTPICQKELTAVNEDLDTYVKEDVQVVAISTDSPFVLRRFKEENELEFPLLSDHDAEVASSFGTKYDGGFTDMQLTRVARRAAFVVDRDGKVKYAEVLDSAGQLPDFDAVHRTLEAIS